MLNPNSVIYQVFVRNYSKQGTFAKVEQDLSRIGKLGADIIYLMPIHEIGEMERKGTHGSPYAIKDYYSISSDLGTLDDFKSLVAATHRKGMKIILDMVFNHTSPDNVLVEKHPEYYFYKDGKRSNRVGDWTDIVDLDTSKPEVQTYLLKVLKYWRELGVDGFRFDVASLIPLEFFKRARKALGKKVIFIGESVNDDFVKYLKKQGIKCTPDKDMYPTFDALYNYNWDYAMDKYIETGDYKLLIKELKDQETSMPKNYLRVNCLANHDTDRIAAKLAQNKDRFTELVNFVYYIKGCSFIYMGEEYGIAHKPDLFEKDPVDWTSGNEDMYAFYEGLIRDKKNPFNAKIVKQDYRWLNDNRIEVRQVNNKGAEMARVFDLNK